MSTASVTNVTPHALPTPLTGKAHYQQIARHNEESGQAALTADAKDRALGVSIVATQGSDLITAELRARFARKASSTAAQPAATPVAEPVATPSAPSTLETLATIINVSRIAVNLIYARVANIAHQNNLTPLRRLVVVSLTACIAMSGIHFLKEASVNCSVKNLEVSACVKTALYTGVTLASGIFLIKIIHQTAYKAMPAKAVKA